MDQKLEPKIRVDGESIPGRCRFCMETIRDGKRLSQKASIPMSAIEVMPEADIRAFVVELAAGAFKGDADVN